jgi:sulfoxide reductase heme-binding subunit YedZ
MGRMTVQGATLGAQPRASVLAGWPLVGWCSLGVFVIAAVELATNGGGEIGWRAVVRATALTSLLLFTAAFTAASAHAMWHTRLTRWTLANRRYLGVSFAASHAVHLLAIVVLAATVPDFTANPTTVVFGGVGYVVLAAMTATSFDRTAAWLGPRAWKRLHTAGVYYLWFIFLASYAPRLSRAPIYLLQTTMLVMALALRLVARRRASTVRHRV